MGTPREGESAPEREGTRSLPGIQEPRRGWLEREGVQLRPQCIHSPPHPAPPMAPTRDLHGGAREKVSPTRQGWEMPPKQYSGSPSPVCTLRGPGLVLARRGSARTREETLPQSTRQALMARAAPTGDNGEKQQRDSRRREEGSPTQLENFTQKSRFQAIFKLSEDLATRSLHIPMATPAGAARPLPPSGRTRAPRVRARGPAHAFSPPGPLGPWGCPPWL